MRISLAINLELGEIVLELLKVAVFLSAFILVFKLSRKLYGGKFTTIIPLLTAGAALFLAQGIIALILHISFGELMDSESIKFGLQILQLVAGVTFVLAFYRLYEITYATVGFFEEKPKAKVR